tara:strand:+ start:340 stop:462 length:123 start_codon:yes stop_codon:yes gene_type:complete
MNLADLLINERKKRDSKIGRPQMKLGGNILGAFLEFIDAV